MGLFSVEHQVARVVALGPSAPSLALCVIHEAVDQRLVLSRASLLVRAYPGEVVAGVLRQERRGAAILGAGGRRRQVELTWTGRDDRVPSQNARGIQGEEAVEVRTLAAGKHRCMPRLGLSFAHVGRVERPVGVQQDPGDPHQPVTDRSVNGVKLKHSSGSRVPGKKVRRTRLT